MSKPLFFLIAALSVGVAPRLTAQRPDGQTQATVSAATVDRMLAVKKPKSKAGARRGPTATQRARAGKLVMVTMPNGERRMVRPKKEANR
jgi:hypothetical protein